MLRVRHHTIEVEALGGSGTCTATRGSILGGCRGSDAVEHGIAGHRGWGGSSRIEPRERPVCPTPGWCSTPPGRRVIHHIGQHSKPWWQIPLAPLLLKPLDAR